MAAPSNSVSEAGWYVLMTNLHETGWHDGLGGEISGWQLNYSAHIKNASIYAEAARWANGDYMDPTGAYFSDIDNDGYDELVMYNDRVFAVFEGIGGRAVNVFAMGSGYSYSVIGVDNAYWAGTQGDYNDVNHVGALSDVGPYYEHNIYDMEVTSGSGSTVSARFSHQHLAKDVSLTAGRSYLDVIYDVGATTTYVKSGYSPGLVDLIWNAEMDRVWVGDIGYVGQRNPNTGATAAIVLGGGGGSFNYEFSGRIMKGDEVYGQGVFEFLLYVGETSVPDSLTGEIAELRSLATSLTDTIGPAPISGTYYPGADKLALRFNQVTKYSPFTVTGVSIDDDDDGVPELILATGTTVIETAHGFNLTLQLTPADAAVIEGLDIQSLELLMSADACYDTADNGNAAVTNTDDVPLSYGEETAVTIDGFIDPTEWNECTMAVPDSNDSQWTAANEIDALYVTWDSSYLYIALDGVVSSNSWIIYLDVDPGGPNGEADLSAIDHWERGAVFTYPGFKCDFQYGCYQHQGIYDSDSFWEIITATTSADRSDSIVSAFDSNHNYGDLGGSELAIPWDVLYGLGPGTVPPNASISIVASLCWDPEPDGELGGDSAPNNVTASLPTVDSVHTFVVDGNGDGVPDPSDDTPPALASAHRDASSDSLINVAYTEAVEETTAENPGNYAVYQTDVPANTIPVLAAELVAPDTVRIALAAPIGGYGYTLSVSNVADASCYGNVIVPGSTTMIRGPITGDDTNEQPAVYAGLLAQNFPNPFNPSTTIRFEVPGRMDAAGAAAEAAGRELSLAVYDVRGRLVKTLVAGILAPGPHSVVWDGTNNGGSRVTSGIYFYRISSGSWVETKKMVLLR
jgi:hypothetical protein